MYTRGASAAGTSPRKEVCLLSLDGGGVRGISALMILKNLMEFIDPRNPPNPCDYFDMIGGTSTGGLIALMLGRLRMSVDECIEAYERMSPDVFTKLHHRVGPTGKSRGRFDHKALEDHIKALLQSRAMSEDALLDDELTPGSCKTFVCATSQKTGRPAVLSSYNNRRRGMDLLRITKIWEAARATSAATTFFEPITIGGETFLDGATGANNPIRKMLDEARDIFGTDRSLRDEDIKCIVSIGTGVPSLKPFGPGFVDIGEGLLAIATDTEEVADSFRKDHSKLFSLRRAFRFNVHPGLEGIGLEDLSKWGDIQAATRLYIQKEEVQEQIEHCVKNLQDREWVVRLRENLVSVISLSITSLNDDEHPKMEELQWLTHTRAYRTWVKGDSGIIWYQQRLETSDETRKGLAAAVMYAMTPSYKSFIGEQFGVGPSLRRVLYYQCDRQQAGNDFDADAPASTTPEEVLWSLICQCIIIDHDTVESFDRRMMQLHTDLRVALQEASTRQTILSVPILFRFLTQTIQACHSPVSIALDSIHLLQGDSCHVFWTTFKSFIKMIRDGQTDQSTTAFISGRRSRLLEDHLHDIPAVDDDTEEKECLSSLHFPEWNARRTQVADAQDGTNGWLWSHTQYTSWEEESTAILWIEGKPGSGKSVLAKSIQRRLSSESVAQEKSSQNKVSSLGHDKIAIIQSKVPDDKVVADWFYSTRLDRVGMAHLSLLRSILFQLLQQHQGMFHAVASIYRLKANVGVEQDWTIDECEQVLGKIGESGTKVICIIDAMDEAADLATESKKSNIATNKSSTILKTLWAIASSATGSKMKFIVLSRPDVQIEMDFNKIRRSTSRAFKIILEQENHKDIRLMIGNGITSLRTAFKALESDSEDESPRHGRKYRGLSQTTLSLSRSQEIAVEDIEKYLISNSGGVVLWVNLIIDQLLDLAQVGGVSLPELQAHAKKLPRSLLEEDGLYEHIANRLQQQKQGADVPRARSIFMLIHGSAVLGRSLLVSEVWEALAVPSIPTEAQDCLSDPIVTNRIGINSWTGFRRHLRSICGAFVEIVRDPCKVAAPQGKETLPDDIGPDDIVQFTHRTIADFLQIKGRSHQLHFSGSEANEHVEQTARTYLRLTFPPTEADYRPQTSEWKQRDWRDNVHEYVAYLQEKNLVQFSLLVLRRYCSDSPDLAYLMRSESFVLSDHLYNFEDAKIDIETMGLFPALNKRNGVGDEELHEAIAVGESFRNACSKGFLVALQNLFAICSFLTDSKIPGRAYDVPFSRLSYAAKNGALASAIVYNMEPQIKRLTKAHRHQTGLLGASIDRWPLETYSGDLDPFIRLAVLSGSVEAVQYLFDHTEKFYSRNAAIREFAVTNTHLIGTADNAHETHDDDSVSSIQSDHLIRLRILNPTTKWRPSPRSSHRVHRGNRRKIRYALLRDACIRVAHLYDSVSFKGIVQDIELAMALVINIKSDMEPGTSPYGLVEPVETQDADDDADEAPLQADAYQRFLDRHTMVNHPRSRSRSRSRERGARGSPRDISRDRNAGDSPRSKSRPRSPRDHMWSLQSSDHWQEMSNHMPATDSWDDDYYTSDEDDGPYDRVHTESFTMLDDGGYGREIRAHRVPPTHESIYQYNDRDEAAEISYQPERRRAYEYDIDYHRWDRQAESPDSHRYVVPNPSRPYTNDVDPPGGWPRRGYEHRYQQQAYEPTTTQRNPLLDPRFEERAWRFQDEYLKSYDRPGAVIYQRPRDRDMQRSQRQSPRRQYVHRPREESRLYTRSSAHDSRRETERNRRPRRSRSLSREPQPRRRIRDIARDIWHS